MSSSPISIRLGSGTHDVALLSSMVNRHGLIAGATGTGKTVTLRVLAERLSALGVPVFLPDVKGDLSGLAQAGSDSPKLRERIDRLGLSDFTFAACPTVFWDVLGKQGHPVRATVSELGPLLFGRLLGLNETQLGVLTIVFRVADDQGLLLLDLKDLRALLQYVADHAAEYKTKYGNVSAASVGAIQRGLLALEEQGGEHFFGEPALAIDDFLQTDADGRGVINVLAADQLLQHPKLYTTFLLWLLAELFENLPEVGDVDKPKLVFIFDEAHLLFSDATPALRERVEQVVRLIRSKGVGVFFATQNPLDLPEAVLGQLGNRIQHALRAFTPKDQKVIQAVASTFRSAPGVNAAQAIGELAVGEALISTLDASGVPTPVERALLDPPRSRLTPLTAAERAAVLKASAVSGHYEAAVDRESAYEQLAARAESAPAAPEKKQADASPVGDAFQAFAKSAMRAAGSQVGRQIMRGLLESMLGSPAPKRRRR
ncbi:MAG TPA: helicase HerA-like domain-containing protein [Polyangiales bacterium]|nr:helicase HerA-like domain-containing protein [Polyangiales bacterium]